MAENKTHVLPDDPAAFFAAQPGQRAEECIALNEIFRRASGVSPTLWRGNLVGYGRYEYTTASGKSETSLATGFSPRKAAISIYIMPGYAEFGDILSRLGPHRMGKACLYVTRLERVDATVLEELIRAGLADLRGRWPVHA